MQNIKLDMNRGYNDRKSQLIKIIIIATKEKNLSYVFVLNHKTRRVKKTNKISIEGEFMNDGAQKTSDKITKEWEDLSRHTSVRLIREQDRSFKCYMIVAPKSKT